MAFFGKLGNILRQTANRNIVSELRSSPSAFQAIRCMCSAPSTKLFVGGISFSTDEQGLRDAFSKYGQVLDARIINDRETGRSRGFGFITYSSVEEASSAIQALDSQELHGRRVRVNYANERPPRAYGGGGGSYGNASYGGGGGYGGPQYGGGYGGNVDGGYRDGGYGRDNYGPGGNYGGNDAANTYSAPNSFETNNTGGGLEYGSSGQFDINNVKEDLGGVGDSIEGNYRDDGDDNDDFAKRA
ncbi:glycine-rich RNA-binding protein 2, mitochondrial-like [Trifolium pratense]|uniref:Uncharacterized protein n=2 Tax=Trifolium pratense TaxID=57577 RepID=A0ACB0LBD4_TRIPR|nr:glycine-rich RNA-binding protein 2, mitochondrial-like [Trifolium pratense]XP_045790555.1 glycine-rich RNA-binding protein 2, mitochondrial-like [Trifolium pratense]CAJ2664652.1 unnamed protein product [Trifolium pratense]